MSTFRAQVLRAPCAAGERPLQAGELDDVAPGPGGVAIDVLACGVCRTDLQLCEGDLAAQRLPIIPGHQIVGTVAALGRDVTGVEVGQRVGVAWIASTCGRCRFCRSGRENLCESATFTGWHRDGGFAERAVADAGFVFPLPDDLDATAAAPLLCGGAIGLRALRVSGIRPGGRLGLYGFGASATCAIQIARHWECEVFVCTRSAGERERAVRLGAAWAGGYDETPPVPLDAAVTFAPVGSVVLDALRALDRGGVVAINAIHLDRVPEFSYDDLWWERQLRSVANVTRADVAELIGLAAEIPIRTEIATYPLADANESLMDLADGRISGAAVLTIARA
ncbi:MAG: zinc-dependent alcohol dehydrogenase family protein [Thermoleophilia bacterium]|nr:zinc-dependent alcohol dehydrogenase family protein [Thermoleophilia bacterium]